MRPLPILRAVLPLLASIALAPSALAQVTLDLHALQALPDTGGGSAPSRPSAPVVRRTAPRAASREAASARPAPETAAVSASGSGAAPGPGAPSGPGTSPATATASAAARPGAASPAGPHAPAAQPALPANVPETASIAPIAPPPLAGPPPPPPPVSDKAATAAAPTVSGLRLTFASGQSDLSPDSVVSLKQLAATAPQGDTTSFNVMAYAPGSANDPSTARRTSLSRAMAVREALIADGVSSARIYVRALGAQSGSGPADRVDVNVMGANLTDSSPSQGPPK